MEADFLTHDAILSVLRAAEQDAKDGVHLWAERYDRAVDDIFAIQDEITLVLATEMQVKLTEGAWFPALHNGGTSVNGVFAQSSPFGVEKGDKIY